VLTGPLRPRTIEFGFLGKDDVRHLKVDVHPIVYQVVVNRIAEIAQR